MLRPDDGLLEPEIAETLVAIDATLASEPVDPRFADLAELSLLIAAEQPQAGPEFARSLDARVQARFALSQRGAKRRRWPFSRRAGAFGLAGAGALAAGAAAVVLAAGGGGSARGPASAVLPVRPASPQSLAGQSTSRPLLPGAGTVGIAAPDAAGSPTPPANGRKIVQSATLELGVPPARVDDVAQQILNVVGAVNGIVDRSSVTSTRGPDGIAQFELRIPSASLARTMSALSQLRYADVVSRTDNTEDVNARFLDAGRRLADASALRSMLLERLAGASDRSQSDRLKAQIRAAEAAVAAAQASLRALDREVSYSQVSVTVQAGAAAPAGGTGFSLRSAAHDALRVLTVAAGVALIALALAVPAGLLGALGRWIYTTARRRRREQALDLA